jgi:hypothetical protein
MSQPQSLPLIIGVGNEYRGDDAVGLIVARRLKERLADSAIVIWLSTRLKERISPPALGYLRKLKRLPAKLSGRRSPQSNLWTRETELSHNDLTAI